MSEIKATFKRATELQCWKCMGHYGDGKMDCENRVCPLYTYMPYRKLEPDLTVFLYSSRDKGKVLLSDKKARVSDKQKEAGKRLAEKARKKREERKLLAK